MAYPPSRNPQWLSVKQTISGPCALMRLLISVVRHGADDQLTFQLRTFTDLLLGWSVSAFSLQPTRVLRLPHAAPRRAPRRARAGRRCAVATADIRSPFLWNCRARGPRSPNQARDVARRPMVPSACCAMDGTAGMLEFAAGRWPTASAVRRCDVICTAAEVLGTEPVPVGAGRCTQCTSSAYEWCAAGC